MDVDTYLSESDALLMKQLLSESYIAVSAYPRHLIGDLAVNLEVLAIVYAEWRSVELETSEPETVNFKHQLSTLCESYISENMRLKSFDVMFYREDAIGELLFWLKQDGVTVDDSTIHRLALSYASRTFHRTRVAMLESVLEVPARTAYYVAGHSSLEYIDKAISAGVDPSILSVLKDSV